MYQKGCYILSARILINILFAPKPSKTTLVAEAVNACAGVGQRGKEDTWVLLKHTPIVSSYPGDFDTELSSFYLCVCVCVCLSLSVSDGWRGRGLSGPESPDRC